MIRLRRRPDSEPPVLRRAKVQRAKNEIAARVNCNGLAGDIPAYWQDDLLRQTLWRLQHKKCGFTERHRRWKLEMDVEHYRPKKGIDDEDGHPGYWWLAYDWSNYLLSDKHANTIHKRNAFPLMANGIRAWEPDDSLGDEMPMLIDPFSEDPEDYFEYEELWAGDEWWVYVRGTDLDGRGDESIRVYGLNELELVEERGELVESLRDLQLQLDNAAASHDSVTMRKLEARVRRETKGKYQFTGYRRSFLKRAGYEDLLPTL